MKHLQHVCTAVIVIVIIALLATSMDIGKYTSYHARGTVAVSGVQDFLLDVEVK